MKRSEMIEILSKRLNPMGLSDELCNEILDILEEKGMLPPQITVPIIVKRQYDNKEGLYYVAKNEWEKE